MNDQVRAIIEEARKLTREERLELLDLLEETGHLARRRDFSWT